MPDRRQFLRGAIGAPLGLLARRRIGQGEASGDTAMRAVVRQQGGFVIVDLATGKTMPVEMPAGTRRIKAHPGSSSLLIELASGALLVRAKGDAGQDIEMQPILSGSQPLVIAERVIGRAENGRDVSIYDLMTGESSLIPDVLLPGESGGWQVHNHPTLPAAVIDARAAGGAVVLLAADRRMPRIVTVPPESSIGIAPDGNGAVRIDRIDNALELVCGSGMHNVLMPYLVLDQDDAELRGPVGASASVLLTVCAERLAVVSCAGSRPQVVDEAIIGGDDVMVGFWQASADGASLLFERIDGHVPAWWWWRVGEEPVRLELPVDLEPGMSSGGAGRWFHGAELAETSLGAGDLRLMTVDMATGEAVFDRVVDRRLELAATGISDDGSLLAHCQSGNADVELLVASFGDQVSNEMFRIDIEDAPVAAAEIVLDVAGDGGAGVVAAGMRWGNPGHHAPMVVMSAVNDGSISEPVRVDGELVGIVASQR